MLTPLVASAALSLGGAPIDSYAVMYSPARDPRPIASMPGPLINGRLWVNRPMMGPEPAPLVPLFRSPGPEYYGAIDNLDARVPVRVGHVVVSISPWERIDQPGLRRLEEARQFWLKENNYTGGVRMFINDRHLWAPPGTHAETSGVQTFTNGRQQAEESEIPRAVPEPRATIQLAPDQPRRRRPLRVEDTGRISWPMAAPIEVVERSSGRVHTVAGR